MIAAGDDLFLPPDFTEGMEELLPRLEKHVIPDAAHWVQQEKPDEVNALLLSWLERNFQPGEQPLRSGATTGGL
jgi:pimeloyl-ACP methyl ester carboxylesterase